YSLSSTNKFGEQVPLPGDAVLPNPMAEVVAPFTLDELTTLHDLPRVVEGIPRKWYLAQMKEEINEWLDHAPATRINFEKRDRLQPPPALKEKLVIDARGFAPEGADSLSLYIANAYHLGWRELIVYRCRGHRFIGCGLSEKSQGMRIHVYGSSGDYLASGLDGAEVLVHGNAQDQVGQIFSRGKLVVYGDVGQTFFYGAKGGDAFIMGN